MLKKEFKVYSPLTKKSVDSFITKSDGSEYYSKELLQPLQETYMMK